MKPLCRGWSVTSEESSEGWIYLKYERFLTYAIGVVICRMMTKIACFGFRVRDLCRRTSNSLVHGLGQTNITR